MSASHQRKALTPMDLPDKVAMTHRILDFQNRYDQTPNQFAGTLLALTCKNACRPSLTKSRKTYESKV